MFQLHSVVGVAHGKVRRCVVVARKHVIALRSTRYSRVFFDYSCSLFSVAAVLIAGSNFCRLCTGARHIRLNVGRSVLLSKLLTQATIRELYHWWVCKIIFLSRWKVITYVNEFSLHILSVTLVSFIDTVSSKTLWPEYEIVSEDECSFDTEASEASDDKSSLVSKAEVDETFKSLLDKFEVWLHGRCC